MSGTRTRGLKGLFARGGDPYAGADLDNARRMIALLWTLGSVLTALFLPFSPPTENLGSAGWVIAALILVGGAVGPWWLLDTRRRADVNQLLAVSYGGIAQVAVLDWLADGSGAAYSGLLVLWVCSGVGLHPPRRAIVLLLVAAVTASLPLLYGADLAEVARVVLLTLAAGSAVLVLMVYVRAQRVGLRAGAHSARQLALEDTLTSLGNRRAFDEALRSEIGRTRRAASPMSLALLDLDGFKNVNDIHGHVVGDEYLRRFADIVRESVRTGDRCFRWGGDELAVLFPDTPIDEAEAVCARVASAVRATNASTDEEPRLGVTYGVTELAAGVDEVAVVRAADSALMAQKESKSRRGARFVRAPE